MSPTRTHALISILLGLATTFLLPPPISQAATPDWNSVSDEQIARLFFPEGKLGVGDAAQGLVDQSDEIDGTLIHEVKRTITNFDSDPEDEMAVLVVYNTAYNYAEYTEALFAILDIENENIKIRWRDEGSVNAPVNISAIKLINKDNFFCLAYTYDRVGAARGSSYQKMKIIRWNGKRFAEIWAYNLKSYDSGNRGGIPHEYSAKVSFVDTKNAKRIKVDAIFTAHGSEEEVPKKEYKLKEEFVWKEKEQRYARVREHKRPPLTQLKAHRAMELPSSPEFTYPRVRSLSPRGVNEEGKHEVVMAAELTDTKGKSQNLTSILSIDLQSGKLSTQQTLSPGRTRGYPGYFCHFGHSEQESSCTIYVKLRDQPHTIFVNSDEWLPRGGDG